MTVKQEPLKAVALTRGNPAEEALPIEELIDCANAVFKREGKVLFQYGHYSGYGPLRQWIANRFNAKVE